MVDLLSAQRDPCGTLLCIAAVWGQAGTVALVRLVCPVWLRAGAALGRLQGRPREECGKERLPVLWTYQQ